MPSTPAATDVFINCPFDPAYQKIFDAIVFAVAACGYRVRSALEIDDSGELRLAKIIRLIEQSKLSIHDISRVSVDKKTRLPRFNMPIELGIALGMKHLGRKALRDHKLLVLDAERFRYRNSASDLAGVDIKEHGDQPEAAIAAVRASIANHASGLLPTEDVIAALYDTFESQLPAMAKAARQSAAKLSYTDRLRHILAFLSSQS